MGGKSLFFLFQPPTKSFDPSDTSSTASSDVAQNFGAYNWDDVERFKVGMD